MVFPLVVGIRKGLGSGSLIERTLPRPSGALGISSYPRDRARRWGRTGPAHGPAGAVFWASGVEWLHTNMPEPDVGVCQVRVLTYLVGRRKQRASIVQGTHQ